MAKNFLELSPSYMESAEKYRARRNAVVEVLNQNYKLTKDNETVFERVKETLAKKGIPISASTFGADKAVFRNAYRYLTAKTEKEQQALLKSVGKTTQGFGVACLAKDGISSWAEIEERWRAKTASPTPAAKQEVLTPPASPRDELRSLMQHANSYVNSLLEENERVIRENANLRQGMTDQEDHIRALQGRIDALYQQLKVAHAATLESIARANPEVPELMAALDKLKGQEDADTYKALLAKLPEKFVWTGTVGEVVYTRPFLKAMAGFPTDAQESILSAVRLLATKTHGNHPQLHTDKTRPGIPNTPPEAFKCRVSGDIRFTWKHVGSRLTLYWVYRKSETTLGQSER